MTKLEEAVEEKREKEVEREVQAGLALPANSRGADVSNDGGSARD